MDILSSSLSTSFTSRSLGAALAGGLVLGCVAITKLRVNGNILGISGIVGGLMKPNLTVQDTAERASFLAGLLTAGGLLAYAAPQTLGVPVTIGFKDALRLGTAGLLVGIGTARGNGCTSGHGIMGNARFSLRSFVATLSFMGVGAGAASIFKSTTWRAALVAPAATAASTVPWPPPVPSSFALALTIAASFGVAVFATVSLLAPSKSSRTSSETDQNLRFGLVRFSVDGLGGLAFGLALGLAGMVDPKNVSSFLDLSGGLSTWDPTLMFVMGGALVLTAPALYILSPASKDKTASGKASTPITCPSYCLPSPTAKPDFKLISGASLFGLGWGLGGICPGPAIVGLGGALASGSIASFMASAGQMIVFNGALFAGWALYHRGAF